MPRVLPAGTVRALGPVLLVLGAAVAAGVRALGWMA